MRSLPILTGLYQSHIHPISSISARDVVVYHDQAPRTVVVPISGSGRVPPTVNDSLQRSSVSTSFFSRAGAISGSYLRIVQVGLHL